MVSLQSFLNAIYDTIKCEDITRLRAKFFVSPTVSRHLGEKKLVPMMKTSGHQGTLQFF